MTYSDGVPPRTALLGIRLKLPNFWVIVEKHADNPVPRAPPELTLFAHQQSPSAKPMASPSSSSSSSGPASDLWPLPSIDVNLEKDEQSVAAGMTRGANYFFGFLVTFVVLFVLFVGCALTSRRRLATRRQALLTDRGDPWVFAYRGRGDGKEMGLVRPVWMERRVESDTGGAKGWAGIMPLATSVVRPDMKVKAEHEVENEREKETTGRESPTSMITTSSRRTPLSISTRLSVASTTKAPEVESALQPNAEVHITIMIVMPLRPETHGPPVYEFGVTRVPLGSGRG
ncbi:hypothetical protein LshimejAT787_1101730 [Lyophyllum shimeji]|uniref:Uncharacterized protein n=1 Tax=Lyophyllum shimeji TaxID=47721 RepID=A0A9P3UR02_LYOSH|nr:hypothetical protein LshimejAT787_1101730 [Lyophyllum shimeji]